MLGRLRMAVDECILTLGSDLVLTIIERPNQADSFEMVIQRDAKRLGERADSFEIWGLIRLRFLGLKFSKTCTNSKREKPLPLSIFRLIKTLLNGLQTQLGLVEVMLMFALAPVPAALTSHPSRKAYPALRQDKVTDLPVTSLAYVKKKSSASF